MPQPTRSVMDANEAVARVAHLYSEVIPIYPITPASPMAEHADAWSAKRRAEPLGDGPRGHRCRARPVRPAPCTVR